MRTMVFFLLLSSVCVGLSFRSSVRSHRSSFLSVRQEGDQEDNKYRDELGKGISNAANNAAALTCMRFQRIGNARAQELASAAGPLIKTTKALTKRQEALKKMVKFATENQADAIHLDHDLRNVDLSNHESISHHITTLKNDNKLGQNLTPQDLDDLHKGLEVMSYQLLNPLNNTIVEAHKMLTDQILPIKTIFYQTQTTANINLHCSADPNNVTTLITPPTSTPTNPANDAVKLTERAHVVKTGKAAENIIYLSYAYQEKSDEYLLQNEVLKIVTALQASLNRKADEVFTDVFSGLQDVLEKLLKQDGHFPQHVLDNKEFKERRDYLKTAFDVLSANKTFANSGEVITDANTIIALKLTQTAPVEFLDVFPVPAKST